jgi:hypothetical protein
MSTDLRAIMDRDERRRRMLNDPDLTGDALLLALALDEVLANRRETQRRLGSWVSDVAELAWGAKPDTDDGYRVKDVIGRDVPRFEPIRDTPGIPCAAPMIRREGLCGKHGTWSTIDRDPESGEARWIGLCARHKELQAKYAARRSAWLANGKPSPPPNIGGVLKRYFKADWDDVYHWAAPWRTPLAGAPEPTPPRPKLRLVRDDESAAGSQP